VNLVSAETPRVSRKISTLNEKPLHAALKRWYTGPTDRLEAAVDGFVIDIVRDDLLVEIQTRNFSSIKHKMAKLTAHHPVRLVFPIARQKWIVRLAADGHSQLGRRKSPKRGALVQVFQELVSFPQLMAEPNFSLHVLLIHEEQVRRLDDKRGWRRNGWVTHERRLLQVVDQRLYRNPADMSELIPSALNEPFSTLELAAAIDKPRRLAQKMAYCLREMGAITPTGKRGNAVLYARAVA
jgi:hypothetical protein